MKFWSNSEIPGVAQHVPEKRLLAAVLQRAVTDFVSGEGDMRDNAFAWLTGQADAEEAPLSFAFICEALDLDAESLRKAILAQATQQESLAQQQAAM